MDEQQAEQMPPSAAVSGIDQAAVDQPLAQPDQTIAEPTPVEPMTAEPMSAESVANEVRPTPLSLDPVDEPAASTAQAPTEPTAASPTPTTEEPSEALADQNIFEMLGVTTGTPEQREQFLDELQQVIWEDFIEHDTKLLLTDSEQAEMQALLAANPDNSLEQQEKVVVFLEKIIPDLEEIMLEKALSLKEEMARERLKALRELHRDNADQLVTIDRAEQLMDQQQWRAASTALNGLG